MPTLPVPSDPKAAPIPVPLDESVRQAWARHGRTIYAVVVLVLLGILGKGAWDYIVIHKELEVRKDYAAASSPESLRAFEASHPGHPLAAMAELRVADDAYATGHFADSVASYEKAAADLPAGPFQARAKLGLAVSQELSGRAADAEAALRQLLNDPNQFKTIRCEAGYHLAALASSAGRTAEVQALAEQLMQIDPSSPFAERVFGLRADLPALAGAPVAPAIALPSKN
jgi:hypothetical protein